VKEVVLTHGGAHSPHSFSDGCHRAAEIARAALERGVDAFAAAIEATASLEDDPRFNAGTGSNLRLDGATIEMDAAAMGSDGRFGAVGCIQRVRHPIRVAAKVLETPHMMIAGDGALAFARRMGFDDHDPSTPEARERYERVLAELRGEEGDYANEANPWRKRKLGALWNFDGAIPTGCDTVGAVVRDAHGRFAATASTGGTVYMLRGRVGDCPMFGCGVYAGPHGAVATTGVGEEIIRRFLAKTVYDWLSEGIAPARAAQRGVAMFPEVVPVGLLVVGKRGQAIASNRNMASAQIVG
jgi:isoaspartyl peptidase/L-asparaginase-like protein (Ntn-hydrolase superfamily)